MTLTADPSAAPSPWVSLWLAPRETIARILATNPRHRVLLLASLTTGLEVATLLIKHKLFDWRIVLAAVLVGVALGIAGLYVSGLLFSWTGQLFGGRATALQLRAVLAWGAAPLLISLLLYVTTKLALQNAANIGVTEPIANALRLVVAFVVVILHAWFVVATMLMLARVQGFGFWRTIFSWAMGSIAAISLWILISLPIRTLLFQAFSIPASSMMPTLLVGDYMFVSKFAYGYGRYSFPLSPPLVTGRIFASEPKRGDVVVFRLPKDTSVDYVKRVIGMPGDHIQMVHGQIVLNGNPVKQEQIEDYLGENPCGSGENSRVRQYRETLPNGVSYNTLDCYDNGFLDNTEVYTVPEGHYFMMGDNRDNSTDSRVPSLGYVPFENLVGRAAIIYFSRDPSGSERTDRIGLSVK